VPGLPDIGIVSKGTPYRIATQPAIWRKDVLLQLLIPGFSAWEFEHLGTTMSEFIDEQVWGPLEPYIFYEQGVEKGKWKPSALSICRDVGVDVDLSLRQAFTQKELQDHFDACLDASGCHAFKMSAIRAYLAGQRMEGLRNIVRYLLRFHFSLQAWIILVAGVCSPAVLQWVRRAHVSSKIRKVRRQAMER